MKKILLFVVFTTFLISLKAQIIVSNTAPYNNATHLVNNVLMGNGVMASNITFAGNGAQLGFFKNGLLGTPALGLDSGIVISTGDVNDIPPGGNQPSVGQYAGPGDIDLLSIAQSVTTNPNASSINSTEDGAFLEFDFTPQGDTVKFRFVFASEEYTTYINTVYNDIFAFFISGPGITGPYAAPALFPNGAINIAKIPSTNIPITISSIHPGLNSQYYISNTTEQSHEFNGFTTVITIKYPVQCDSTYHFKIAVADCQDDYLDTGVFLEASSFSSAAVQVDVVTATGDSTVIEGCTDAILTFTRPDSIGSYTVHFDIGGNAINGTDYNFIVDSVTFAAGQNTTTVTINPFADTLTEGTDTVIITVYTINPCGDTIISTGIIYIIDPPEIITSSRDTTLFCPVGSLNISTIASGGVNPYSYSWTNSNGGPIGTNNPTITVSGLQTDTFYVSVTDSCNLKTGYDTIIVTLNIPPLTLTTNNDTTICPGDAITLTALVTGGRPGYNYTWTPGGNTQSITVSPVGTVAYIIAITDSCNTITVYDTVIVSTDYTPMTITIPPLASICVGEELEVSALVYNGIPPYTYSWSDGINNFVGNPFMYPTDNPSQTTLNFIVTDNCGNQETATVDVEVIACAIIIPNIFTPNNDGSNDFLVFENLEYFPNNKLVVYNRWGQKLLEKEGYQNDWNGGDAPDGTYFYLLELNNKANTLHKGSITIIR
jgi:gliding motility-associated-like protein